jgi:formate hydrogenlyase transcriptional activator
MSTHRTPAIPPQTCTRERDFLLAMREISDALVSKRNLDQLMFALAESIRRFVGLSCTEILLHDATNDSFLRAALHLTSDNGQIERNWVQAMDESPAPTAFRTRQPISGERVVIEREACHFQQVADWSSVGIQSFCCVPLISHETVLGTLNVGSLECPRFMPSFIEFLNDTAKLIAILLESSLASKQITALQEKLLHERSYLDGEVRADCTFAGMIGQSEALRSVLEQAQDVAESDATVLLLGETGTGKELVARALHNLSRRKDRTFVKLNCAAIPAGLLESELFGHERGAFTGAINTKVGLLELANHATLFLDEVGDIPLEIQPKLLRVLQEGEFARIGSTRTIKIDVRLIAATNRDLLKMVREKEYRSDLFYRLNVFPITLPPLRERKEDIPLLVKHFTQKSAARNKRSISLISSEAMEALAGWNWPGNVRELENLIERAVILSKGPVLNVPLKDLQDGPRHSSTTLQMTVEHTPAEITADVILRTLRETNGIVSGPRGAAVRLGLKRTTLLWRMNSLGITRKQALS